MKQEEIIQDDIPESVMARCVYISSFIPILGAILFFPLGFAALIQIGKGRTGFWLLQKGLIRNIWTTALGLLAIATYWFCPQWKYEEQENYYESNRTGCTYDETAYGKGYVMRRWEWPEKFVKVGTWTFYYNNLQTKFFEEHFWDDKRTGDYKLWHRNGRLRISGTYQNGKAIGLWTVWYANGNKMNEGIIHEDKCVGEWNTWTVDGLKNNSVYFDDSKNSGRCIEWHSNGKIKAEGFFSRANYTIDMISDRGRGIYIRHVDGGFEPIRFGETDYWYNGDNVIKRKRGKSAYKDLPMEFELVKSDLWTYYDESGKKTAEELILYNGHSKETKWYPSGQIQEEGSSLHKRKNGKWKEWYENGQLQSEGIYSNGKYSGLWTWWYEDGQRWCEGAYKKGVENGMWRRWHYNGVLMEEGFYTDGKKYGCWTYFYPSGVAVSSGEYVADNQNGWWIYRETNGKIGFIGEFKDGKEIGPWTTWYENGHKMKEGTYAMPGDILKDDDVCGYRIGLWRTWNEDGQLLKRDYYDSSGQHIATKNETASDN